MGDVKIMWSAVCSLAPHSHFAEEARPHQCIDKPKRPTPVRKRLSLTQTVLVKLNPIGLVVVNETKPKKKVESTFSMLWRAPLISDKARVWPSRHS